MPSRIGSIAALFMMMAAVAAPAARGQALKVDKEQILPLLEKACDWQLAQLPTEHTGTQDKPDGWIRAPFYDGVMALYDVGHQQRYLDAMLAIAEANHWQPASRTRRFSGLPGDSALTGEAAKQPFLRHADDLAIGQLYCELYFVRHDPAMIAPLRQRLDQIMGEPKAGREDWWWCDSLFMAPPTYARLAAATGDAKYLDYMNHQWWDTTDFLFDKSQHLYFRDKSYFNKKEANGQPVFWSRGNGWVMAGIVRVLQYMPADYPDRPRYVSLLKEMSTRLAQLQQPDGSWSVSLLDPASYVGKETSGTGFDCYAMAWGINHNLLPRDQFEPVVSRAWNVLTTVVDPASGKVGWVQKVGAAPAAVVESSTAEYGTGALLLAGSEVLKMQ